MLKVFNLMLKANETRFLVQHESCKCKCGLWDGIMINVGVSLRN